ncbi:MAG: PKD domain-containing protein, partial [Armatimonadetes bacterium]|nr:PKD domain-containing protein [Armatimonadota bacterium]
TAQISIEAHDPDGDALTYTWSAAAGTLSGSGATVTWTAPNTEGTYSVTVSVKDAKHPAVTQSCAVVVSSGARYQVQEVEGFNPRGMNNHGQIAGSSGDHPAAVWDNGVVTPLPQPADRQYQAMDINDQGVVVGLGLWRSYSGNAVYRACRWRNDQFSLLDGDWHRDTLQINNIGRYAGVLYPFTHEEGPNVGLPWGMRAGQDGVTLLAPPCPIYYLDQENDQFYNSGQNYDASMTYANAINDTGHVAGYSHIARYSGLGTLDVYHATLWENGTPIDLDAGRDGTSHAYGLNNVNRVVGLYVEGFDFQSRAQACQWFAGQRTPLPDLPGTNTSEARAINNANQIVGQCRVGTDWRAVLWENGTAIDLNTVCDPLPNGRVLLEPLEINDAGQILCRALGPEETANKWYLLTPRQSRQRMPRRTAGGMEDEDPLRSARAAAGALPAPDRMRQLVSHPAKPLPRY